MDRGFPQCSQSHSNDLVSGKITLHADMVKIMHVSMCIPSGCQTSLSLVNALLHLGNSLHNVDSVTIVAVMTVFIKLTETISKMYITHYIYGVNGLQTI